MKEKIKNFLKSFMYAGQGIKKALKQEKNMKIHVCIMFLVIIAGVILKISKLEWIICIICFAMVIGAEMFNTAIEEVVNIAMPQINDKAKFAKDASAGAVLIFAVGAAIIGLIIFIPKIVTIIICRAWLP